MPENKPSTHGQAFRAPGPEESSAHLPRTHKVRVHTACAIDSEWHKKGEEIIVQEIQFNALSRYLELIEVVKAAA